MQKRILVIQSRRRPDMLATEKREYSIAVGGGATLTCISALDASLPWDTPEQIIAGYDAVFLGGSGEFDLHGNRAENDEARVTARAILASLSPLIDHVLTTDTPTLGICFGHQLIGEYRAGLVHGDALQKKIGSHRVTLTEEGKTDPLFSQLPATFLAQYGHRDSLSTLPEGATLLGVGQQCRFSALRYGKHIYTVQFHPEMTAEGVYFRMHNTPGYLPEGVDLAALIKESPEASTLMSRFVEQLPFTEGTPTLDTVS